MLVVLPVPMLPDPREMDFPGSQDELGRACSETGVRGWENVPLPPIAFRDTAWTMITINQQR